MKVGTLVGLIVRLGTIDGDGVVRSVEDGVVVGLLVRLGLGEEVAINKSGLEKPCVNFVGVLMGRIA